MYFYSIRMLRSQPLRLALTVGGIALCAVLMLFLLGVYRGVSYGSVEYIRCNRADLWVLERNQTNILRCSSILQGDHGATIRQIPGAESVSGILLVLSSVRKGDRVATLFMTGFDPESGIGGPPRIVEGRSVVHDDQIVLDAAFAAKFDLSPGDTVQVQDRELQVVGISTGSNAFVIQYAFATLRCVQSMVAIPDLVTCYLVDVEEGEELDRFAGEIRDKLPGVDVYDHETFLENNVQEMQAGFLPLMFAIAAIGVVVLTVILSLLLSINILEWRRDFAVMKTLGSPGAFLSRLIVQHSVTLALCGMVVALCVFFPMVALIETVAPEVSTKSSVAQIASVALVVAVISVLSAGISMQRLRRIYPLEAFS